uniref:Uncharacterized protein n=1 Tax=Anguilla anguilla TaxID=7936 RepID=A0A0E9VLK2_ANGAN
MCHWISSEKPLGVHFLGALQVNCPRGTSLCPSPLQNICETIKKST